jgi:hypothetical protein
MPRTTPGVILKNVIVAPKQPLSGCSEAWTQQRMDGCRSLHEQLISGLL